MTTAVLGCPDCDWEDSSVPTIDVEHVCGQGDVLFCDQCGWSYTVYGDRPAGFTAAMIEVHLTRPGHVDPRPETT